jgi:dephospho-CoA kinase
LATLNSITHPLVRDWSAAKVAIAAAEGRQELVQDIPLLFENGLDGLFAATILVWVPPETQVSRLLKGRGFDETDARARIARQLPIDTKREKATYVIDNSGSREATRAQTEKVWTEITAGRSTGP